MAYSKEYLTLLKLTAKGVSDDEIVDLDTLAEGEPTSNFVKFVYKNVVSLHNPFQIQPFELFLIKKDVVNAFACHYKGMNIIVIYLKLFKVLEVKLRTNFPIMKGPGVDQMKKLSPALKNKNGVVPQDFLLYQYATLFSYFHELAHLYQLSQKAVGAGAPLVTEEKYDLVGFKNFDKHAHALEIDADIFAANIMSEHIFQYWKRFEPEYQTVDNFSTMMSMVCASIFVFFYTMSDGWKPIYFTESNHPHPIIRISYIANALAANAAANVGVNEAGCLHNGLEIAQEILISGGEQGIAAYIDLYKNNMDKIGEYIQTEMNPYMKTLPYLVQNSF